MVGDVQSPTILRLIGFLRLEADDHRVGRVRFLVEEFDQIGILRDIARQLQLLRMAKTESFQRILVKEPGVPDRGRRGLTGKVKGVVEGFRTRMSSRVMFRLSRPFSSIGIESTRRICTFVIRPRASTTPSFEPVLGVAPGAGAGGGSKREMNAGPRRTGSLLQLDLAGDLEHRGQGISRRRLVDLEQGPFELKIAILGQRTEEILGRLAGDSPGVPDPPRRPRQDGRELRQENLIDDGPVLGLPQVTALGQADELREPARCEGDTRWSCPEAMEVWTDSGGGPGRS